MTRVAVAQHGLATMVHQLADDKVQLQIGHRFTGLAFDETAGFGKVGGERTGACIAPLPHAAQDVDGAGQRQAEQIGGARRVHDLHHVQVVVQVLAHAGQVVHGGDAVPLQLRARADAREHQQLGREQRAGAQQHFARAAQLAQFTAAAAAWRDCSINCRRSASRPGVSATAAAAVALVVNGLGLLMRPPGPCGHAAF